MDNCPHAVGQPLKLWLNSSCIIGIDIAAAVTALFQCGSSLREAGRLVTSSVAQLDPLLQANQVIWYLEAPGAPFSFLEPKGRFSKGFQHLRVTWPPGCPCCVAESEYLCAMLGLPWWAPRYLQSTQEKCEHVGDGVRVNASKSFSNVKHEDFKPMLIFTEPCRFKNAPC